MFNIIVFTHGSLGRELVKTSEMIVGEHEGVEAFSVMPGCDLESLRESIRDSLTQSGKARKSVLVLTDLPYGTPFNIMAALRESCEFRHITGVNLTLLTEALSRKDEEALDGAVSEMAKIAREGIFEEELL